MPEVLFVGREREQDVYKKFLAKETPWVLIITGLGGIGKTTLLHRLAEYTSSESTLFKTGVVALDFANEDLRNDPLKILDKITADTASYCDLQQIDSDFRETLQQNFDQLTQLSIERAQTGNIESDDLALREIHHQMRELAKEAFYTQIKTLRLNELVIMLDTCEWLNEPEGIEVGQWMLNELVPGLHARIRQQGRQCHVVMVSRVQLKLDVINGRDQQRLTLPMLGMAEVDYYLEHMGMQDVELRQRVFEVTHGHALCVSIIGDFWKQREAQKEPLTIADFPELKLQEFSEIALMQFTNERVLKQLKSPFKELTRYGVLLRSFDLPFLRNVFPELLPEDDALEIFNRLIRYPYIESRGNYRYAFHELLREALSEVTQKEESDEWKVYHKRALDYLTKESPHSPDWYYHLLAYDEKQGLVEWQRAIQEARESGKREIIGALLQAALDEALHLSPATQAEVSYEQGRFNFYGVQWKEALKSYSVALAFFKQVEDYSGQAKVLQALGDVQRALGKQDEALRSYEQALTLFRQVGDQFGEARSCQAMGDVHRLRFDQDAALHNYEQCYTIFQQLKDKSEEAKVLEAMGDIQLLRLDLDAALHNYEQALALYQEEKDRLKRAKVLKAIGDIQRFRHDKNAALESYGQALALFGELKEPTEEANVRLVMEEMQNINNIEEKENMTVIQSNSWTSNDTVGVARSLHNTGPMRPAGANSTPTITSKVGVGVASKWLILTVAALVIIGSSSIILTHAFVPTTPPPVLINSGTNVVMAGGILQLHGRGFQPGGSVTLTFDNGLPVSLSGQHGTQNISQGIAKSTSLTGMSQMYIAGVLLPRSAADENITVSSTGTFDANVTVPSGLQAGGHTIHATENQSSQRASLQFTIPSPQLTVNPTSLHFGSVEVGRTVKLSATLSNQGGASLLWTATVEGSNTNWLTISSSSGIIGKNGLSEPIIVTANTNRLSVGLHSDTLRFHSDNGDVQTKVNINVIPIAQSGQQAILNVPQQNLDFGSIQSGQQAQQRISIANLGNLPLQWQASSDTASATWLSVVTTKGTVQPGGTPQTVQVHVNTTSLAAGSYSGTITITSNGGNAQVGVTLVVNAGTLPLPPALYVSPTNLDFGMVNVGQLSTRIIIVGNAGAGTLNWVANTGSIPWVALDSNYGSLSPGNQEAITVKIDTTNLPLGNNAATINITSNGGSVQVPLTLVVIQVG